MRGRLLAFAAIASAATSAAAQNWTTLTAQRALGREDSLRVVLTYGLGKLTLRAAAPATLYDLDIRYDAEVFRAEKHYDPATHTLTVGADSGTAERLTLSPGNFHGNRGKKTKGGEMTLALARGVPLDLTVNVGVGAADIDLGDLWVDRAHFDAAMGAAEISFPTPNVHPMRELTFEAAFGGLHIDHLGNARAQKVKVDVALGGGEIDLRGDWTGEMALDLRTALGGFHISVPADAGVRITAVKRLAGLDAKGFTLRDGVYYSPNYESAKRKLIIQANATLAGYSVDWIAP